MLPSSRYTTTWANTINQVTPQQWNSLSAHLATPFLEWEWLANLENSDCATEREGWLSHHLLVWQGQELVGGAPLYLKSHSWGEFVFDQQWADLSHRLGINYYPKLLGMSPFTPAGGYRFLLHPDLSPDEQSKIIDLIISSIDHFCDQNHINTCHFLYVDPTWKHELENRGFTTWMHHSYIWENQQFKDFNDYLQAFNANQRRNIKRERQAIGKYGITIKPYTGKDAPRSFYDLMYGFYSDHCDKFWGSSKYLNRRFFEGLIHNYAERVVFFAAEIEDLPHPVGMSFCIRKGDQLYGRYWGAVQDIDCLHFNACYYAPIDWAVSQGIQRFDPGAGGEHKKRRGFPAVPNYSLHRFYNHRLGQIIRGYIQEVNAYEVKAIQAINQELPFDVLEPTLAI